MIYSLSLCISQRNQISCKRRSVRWAQLRQLEEGIEWETESGNYNCGPDIEPAPARMARGETGQQGKQVWNER